MYINGNYKGKASQNIDLSFGEQIVKLTGIDKYKDTEHTINIRQNGKKHIHCNLKQNTKQTIKWYWLKEEHSKWEEIAMMMNNQYTL